ncbi:TetR/AcrR family transcriptional regulator, partial [Staphylococcus chromogenes]
SYTEWQSTIVNEGIDPVDATIMRLAIDGLWLSEIFEFSAIDETMREAVLNRLKDYTQQS